MSGDLTGLCLYMLTLQSYLPPECFMLNIRSMLLALFTENYPSAKQFLKLKNTLVDFGLVIFNITTKNNTSLKINIKSVRMNILVHKNTYY